MRLLHFSVTMVDVILNFSWHMAETHNNGMFFPHLNKQTIQEPKTLSKKLNAYIFLWR